MTRLIFFCILLVYSSFTIPNQNNSYMFIVLREIPACDGKCNNYELMEYPKKTEAECKKQEDSAKIKYGTKATCYTISPSEGAVYYKYNKFVPNCDCKILGVHKSASVAKATEEINLKVAEEKAKKPKAYHNFEIYSTWPR